MKKIKRSEMAATFSQHSRWYGTNGAFVCICNYSYGAYEPTASRVVDHQIEMMRPKGFRLYLKKK